jgi:hypothetical protein
VIISSKEDENNNQESFIEALLFEIGLQRQTGFKEKNGRLDFTPTHSFKPYSPCLCNVLILALQTPLLWAAH